MRYTKLRTWFILLAGIVCVIVIIHYAEKGRGIYKSASPVTDSLITNSYPKLYEAITHRDAQLLKPFLSHESKEVRRQAWRALANTPVDSISTFIELAEAQNSEVAWFAVSQLSLDPEKLRELERLWTEHPEYRPGINLVLGVQGDRQSLKFLLNNLNEDSAANSWAMGLAVGRLVNRFDATPQQQVSIIQNAFAADSNATTRSYLYGWYRGDESRLSSAAADTLFDLWRVQGSGVSAEVDQYVNEILKDRTTARLVIFYNGEQRLDTETQLSVELAKSIATLQMNNRNSLAAKILLTNDNPHVKMQVLKSIRDKVEAGGDLYNYVSGTMLTDSTLAHPVWIQALHTASRVDRLLVDKYENRLQNIISQNVYLLSEALAIYEESESIDKYLTRISGIVNKGNAQKTMYALQRLGTFWQNLSEDEYTSDRIRKVRTIVFDALATADRGVAFNAQSLLQDNEIFEASDFEKINGYLSAFTLPGDIEVFQTFGSLYYDRFREQAQSTIDSLASLKYQPLNRSLSDAGWDVEVPEEITTNFRLPDWERLWQLGRYQVWTLKTEAGNIDIRLNTLSAPATVSMIDSLSRAGAYDGVPFHRVVPNFVIQGGDIERQDGFGGPDFVIPTEASERGFVRGAAGIASAGTDTEGSQYFFMHQWKPHLNGSYTRFGIVTSGKDVVDRVTVGDSVLSTTWY